MQISHIARFVIFSPPKNAYSILVKKIKFKEFMMKIEE